MKGYSKSISVLLCLLFVTILFSACVLQQTTLSFETIDRQIMPVIKEEFLPSEVEMYWEEEPKMVVIASPDKISLLNPYISPHTRPDLNNTDFDNYFIIAVFQGMKRAGAGDYDVTIERIVHSGDTIKVYARFEDRTGQFENLMVSSPYHVVRVEKPSGFAVEEAQFILIANGQEVVKERGKWSGYPDDLGDTLQNSPYPPPDTPTPPSYPPPAKPTPPPSTTLTQIALQYVADTEGTALSDLVVFNEHNRSYTLTGQNLWAVTVFSRRTSHYYELLVDPSDGSVLDHAIIESAEREAHQDYYGKLEPDLHALLEEKDPDDEVSVTIWLTAIDMDSVLDQLVARYPEVDRDSGRPMDVDDPVLAETIASDYQELLASAHYLKEKDIVDYLHDQGYEVTTYRYIPAVTATLPKWLILQIEERIDVSHIYLTGKSIQGDNR